MFAWLLVFHEKVFYIWGMNELIKVEKNRVIGKLVVNARDLHVFLEVGKDFSTWLKGKFRKYGFIENVDYVRIFFDITGNKTDLSNRGINGVNRIEYGISLDVAKELGMVQNNERGRQIRQYFIEVERIYRTNYFVDYINRVSLIPYLKKTYWFKTYFLRDRNTGMIKIGKATNVGRRIEQIKRLNPSTELILVLNRNVELDLHHEYKHKRDVGEWFNLTENDIINIKIKYHERTD